MLRMTVLYPAGEDATFDWDYYLSDHMALIEEKWGPYVERSETAKGVSALPKGDPAFVASAAIYFADNDALQSAMKAGGMDIPKDIPNFTNVQPSMQIDEVV